MPEYMTFFSLLSAFHRSPRSDDTQASACKQSTEITYKNITASDETIQLICGCPDQNNPPVSK